MRFAAAIAVLLCSFTPGLAGEASFDCARAASPSEQAICSDDNANLGSRDIILARLYAALVEDGGHAAIVQEQADWLKARDACGADAACLRTAYDARLQVLAKAGGDEVGVTGSYAFNDTAIESTGEGFVVRGADGTLVGELRSLSGPQKYGCEVVFDAAPAFGDTWIWTDNETEPDDEGNRCQILFRGDGRSLRVDSRFCSLYCGVHARFDETYQKVK